MLDYQTCADPFFVVFSTGQGLIFQGMIQNDIAMSRVEIDQARLMTLQAARCIDHMGTKHARKQVKILTLNI